MHAVRIHNVGAMSALLACNDVNVNILDATGMNALDHARHMGWTDIGRSLSKKDVDSTNQSSTKKLKPSHPNLTFDPSFSVKVS